MPNVYRSVIIAYLGTKFSISIDRVASILEKVKYFYSGLHCLSRLFEEWRNVITEVGIYLVILEPRQNAVSSVMCLLVKLESLAYVF